MIGARHLAGRYRLLNPLGEGGAGTVWLAADDVLSRDVAVKEVRLAPGLDEARRREICEAAVREANVAARLKHPSIVTVHDVLVEDGRPWLVMELLNGTSLEQMVRERGPMPPHQAARIGVHLLSALAVAHAAGVVHRDIKPSNVLLTRTGRAVLTDFGIASVAGEATDRTAHLVGSPAFVAPERLRGEEEGPASDLWSLGATLYFAVEGVPPHDAETPVAVLTKVLVEPPRPPERAGPLTPVLTALLNPEPAARPAIPAATGQLRDLTEGRPGSVPWGVEQAVPAPPEQETPAAPGRGRTALLAGSMVAALAVVAAGTVVVVNVTASAGAAAAPAPLATRLSETPGKFSVPVKFCDLFTPAQIGRLVPDVAKPKGEPDNTGGCDWTAKGVGLSAAPTLLGLEEKHWGASPQLAHERFVNQRNATIPSGTVAWSWPEISAGLRSARTTGPEPVGGIGDEAFTYQVYDNRNHLKLEQSYMVFRVDNLVAQVGYTVVDGSQDEKSIRDGAKQAAGWMVAALKRTG
ncbi:hypothetical protein Misp01_03800 [Microtetraspora sp. NBRC 13810]|uniref:serine/threonine-protein kinase n=1 Tax=Microtetraspora sp. NBRC 13810 TaxID=3030990 RepID=UPI0024A10B79|nr:serine/threonine-protein kinase [Microtetraspora sp. NBRC 13810]GLW05250.1 hypothetical protein Misp01_03800 [Microtetraspora sp. NBRC 13810]